MCGTQQVRLVAVQKLVGRPVEWCPRMRANIHVTENVILAPHDEHLEALVPAAKTEPLSAQVRNFIHAAEDVAGRRRTDRTCTAQGLMPPILQMSFQCLGVTGTTDKRD